MKKGTVVIGLLLGSTAFCHAQTQTLPWSVGVQAAAQRYEVRYSLSGLKAVTLTPAQLTVGYRLTPRLLAQAAFAYRKKSNTVFYLLDTLRSTGVQRPETYQSVAVPLTLRYTVSQHLDKRLLLDVVGGVTLFYSKHHFVRPTFTLPRMVDPAEEAALRVYLTFGLSGRYRFTSHFEGVADLLLNKSTDGGTLSPRFYNAALGVRYNF